MAISRPGSLCLEAAKNSGLIVGLCLALDTNANGSINLVTEIFQDCLVCISHTDNLALAMINIKQCGTLLMSRVFGYSALGIGKGFDKRADFLYKTPEMLHAFYKIYAGRTEKFTTRRQSMTINYKRYKVLAKSGKDKAYLPHLDVLTQQDLDDVSYEHGPQLPNAFFVCNLPLKSSPEAFHRLPIFTPYSE